MTLRAKILAGIAGIFLPVALLCLLAINALGATNDNTTRLYQARLLPSITMSQLVENLDQMRQLVAQFVLTPRAQDATIRTGQNVGVSLKILHLGVEIEITTLDGAITRQLAEYRTLAPDADQQPFLAQWPRAWQTFVAMRARLLDESLASRQGHEQAIAELTTLFNDRLNTLLDLAFRLLGAQQSHGYGLYQSSQQTYARTFDLLMAGLVLLALVSIAAALTLAGSIVRPLRRVTAAAGGIARGELAQTLQGEERRADEIGHLAQSFAVMMAYLDGMAGAADLIAQGDLSTTPAPASDADRLGHSFVQMTERLRLLIAQVAGATTTVITTSAGVTTSANQVREATFGVAQAIEEVARGAAEQTQHARSSVAEMAALHELILHVERGVSEQHDALTQSQQAAERLDHSLTRIDENTAGVSAAAQEAATTARRSHDAVRQTVEAIEAIRHSVNLSVARANDLGASSNQIGAIVETIDDIAAQTNLLALNAAIEAARAGEHGRGFAVVAAEVRKLAERVQGATGEVGTLVQRVREQIDEALTSMRHGAEQVAHGAGLGAEAGTTIEQTLRHVEQTSDQIQQIAEGTSAMRPAARAVHDEVRRLLAICDQTSGHVHEMSAGGQRVAGALETMATISGQTAGNAEAVSAATQETTALAHAMADASEVLVRETTGVQQAIGAFSLGTEATAVHGERRANSRGAALPAPSVASRDDGAARRLSA